MNDKPVFSPGESTTESGQASFFCVVGAKEVRAWNASVPKIAIIGPKLKCVRCEKTQKKEAVRPSCHRNEIGVDAPRHKKSNDSKGHSGGQGDRRGFENGG